MMWSDAVIGLLSFCLVPCIDAATPTPTVTPQPGIVQLLRDQGFRHDTAQWTSVCAQTTFDGQTTRTRTQVWIRGQQYRLETKDNQNGKRMVLIDTGKEKYLYTPEEKKAVVWNPSMEAMVAGLLNGDMVAESARRRQNAKKIGGALIDGDKACNLYAYTSTFAFMNTSVTVDVKEWVWARYNFPIQSVVKTPAHTMQIALATQDVPASTTVNRVQDLVLDQPLDASLFQLPAGTVIENLNLPQTGLPLLPVSSPDTPTGFSTPQ